MKVDLVKKTETSYITLVTETGSGPSTALANVADMLSIDWDSIEGVQLLFVRKFQAALLNSMSCSSREIGGLPG